MNEEILYICMECKTKENIPKEVVEFFDEMDLSNINGQPCSSCEKCGGVIRTQKYNGIHGKEYKL